MGEEGGRWRRERVGRTLVHKLVDGGEGNVVLEGLSDGDDFSH
jgi:hypothetical protein